MKPAWKELLIAVNGAFLFLLILLATEMALGQSAEVPERARILSVQTDGTGCEATQTAVSLSPDLMDLSVLFSNFNLELGAGTPDPNNILVNKNCQIRVEIETPAGWALSVKSVDYRGYAHLPVGAIARHRFSYRTDGMQTVMLREAPLQGPLDQDYFFRLEQSAQERPFTPCGPPNIRLRLGSHMVLRYPLKEQRRNGADRETAILSLDSADVSLKQDFQLEWKRCGRKAGLK
ncbi:MAG: DUF4360 domain-containing protein [Bdellovibrionales bacterium]|nr:DUF4360 domain-containing protein [Bdellovibrionales bacterium]